jgi:hypothetical protein
MEMTVKSQSKKKYYKGKNVRISDAAFDKIKVFVDEKGLKLGRFVEDAVLEKLQKEKK